MTILGLASVHPTSENRLPPLPIDATACEREPIHAPGAIQPHGALLAVRCDSRIVSHASSNLHSFLGVQPAEAIGRPLEEFLEQSVCRALLDDVPGAAVARLAAHRRANPDAPALYLHSHRSGAHVCIDIEPMPVSSAADLFLLQTQAVVDSFQTAQTRLALCEIAVRGLKEMSGYDRVMAYRFGANGHGDVIAEECGEDMVQYSGLRYPASDIPPQARRQYLAQRVGAISNSSYIPVPLLCAAADVDPPLDLTCSALRSVSPVHCEYMRNMRTAASLTIGLAHGGELWGMLVCHHSAPRTASPELRAAVGMIGQVVSLLLGRVGESELAAQQRERGTLLEKIVDGLSRPIPLHEALAGSQDPLLSLVEARGVLIRMGGVTTLLGATPPRVTAEAALGVLQAEAVSRTFACEDFAMRHPDLRDCMRDGSGVLVLPLESAPGDAIVWFRPELSSTVLWGGDPSRHVTADAVSGRLSPRTSFAAWQETVHGRSAPWCDVDLAVAEELRQALASAAATRTTDALRESESRFQLLAEHSGVVVTLNDLDDTHRYVSPAARSVLGWEPEDMVGRPAIDLVHPDDRGAFRDAHTALLAGTAERSACYRYMRPDGSWLWIEGHARLRVEAGATEPTDYVVVLRDATERKAAETKLVAALDRMERMASIDGLTGIANRRHFDTAAEREWRRCERDHLPLSVLLVDADHFKLYNDRYGHLAGDVCLRAIAGQLESISRRPGDLAARYGGEEFLLLLPNTGREGAVRVAKKFRMLVQELGIPHEGSLVSNVVTVSVGVARAWPGRSEPEPQTIESLLLKADTALYRAKSIGRNRVVSAPSSMQEDSRYGSLETSVPSLPALVEHHPAQLAPLTERADGYETLMQFLYRAPIGLVQTRVDGSVEMINPMSANLLMPLSRNGNLDNLFVALEYVAPQFRAWVEAFDAPSGAICDGVRISLAGVSHDGAVQVLSISVLKLDEHRLMATVSDVTQDVERERHGIARRLAAASRTDYLTQLPNRAAMRDRIQLAIDTASADTGNDFAVLFINCDRFRQINDAFGHAAGDAVLESIAERLKAFVRGARQAIGLDSAEQMAGRLGGDEFVLLLDNLRSPDDARALAIQLLDALSKPHSVHSRQLQCSISMGIVLRAEIDSSADVVLQDASIAMDEAKRAGGARFVLFEPLMHERAALRASVETDLRRALLANELFVAYQPVIPLQGAGWREPGGARCMGVEALVRWRHPARGIVPPFEFINVAERCGLIGAVGAFVLESACRQFVAWQKGLLASAPRLLAVNLSRAQLGEPGFVTLVETILRDTGMQPSHLQLEITESLAAQDESVQSRLHELKALGLTLALDDFGTGYSSLASLHLLPVDTVKIDRSFVSEAVTSAHHRVLIEATIRVAKSLGMETVAEGIETEAQAQLLHEFGCDTGQGYLFSKPLESAELGRWLLG